jgi:hypothetical protein
VLGRHCEVRDSIILPSSYVGEAVELDGMVVDRDRLIHSTGARGVVPRPDVLGDLDDRPMRRWLAA